MMSLRRLVILSFLVIGIFSLTLIQTSALLFGTDLVAGRNVNMVNDDPFLQRQNEPSFDVSSINPRHLLAGANDYSLVDFVGEEVDVTYDSWLGVFKSYDGGESWEHDLLPPYQGVLQGGPVDTNHPLYGFDAAADPTVRAGKDGWFFYSGIAFNRERNGRSVVFVARYKDNGSTIDYVDTTIIDEGTSGQFQDKPWIGTDKDNKAFIIYSIFLGEINNNIHSKIMISRSLDGGNSWKKPSKISEGQQKNQGTTIIYDLNYDIIYVAWRRFQSSNETNAILIVKSEDFGQTFTKAELVREIEFPFDQPTEPDLAIYSGPAQFRTNSYPTIAVDFNGRIYVAWTERISELGDARIVITSLARNDWGNTWPPAQPVEVPFEITTTSIENPRIADETPIPGYQFMPTMLYSPAANKLLIAWFDTRFSARRYDEFRELRDDAWDTIQWIRDGGDGCPYRETVDVRLAQADPGPSLLFEDSIQVSRYLWVLVDDPENPGFFKLRQGQFNPPNYRMFSAGTKPFHGDYIDIAHSPDDPYTYYVTWTDNRDVRPPAYDDLWNTYIKPEPIDPENPGDCVIDPNAVKVGMRNQNVYCSKITRGVNIGTFQNNLAPGNTSFVIYAQNLLNPPYLEDLYDGEEFILNILSPNSASFSPEDSTLTSISASVPYYSTIVRQVFVSGNSGDVFRVSVSAPNIGFYDEISLRLVTNGAPGGTENIILNGSTKIDWNDPELITELNPSITNPSITNPSITNISVLNPSITNPSITNPSITNPSITNPSITNPSITNPGIDNPSITNPSITNPTIATPSITNENIVNPSITNPSITNDPPGAAVADKVWSVHNQGDTVTAYTFKGIAGDELPAEEIFSQLIIYKVHYTHSTNGCYLMTEAHHELLMNVLNPFLTTDTTSLDIQQFLADPEAYNSDISNATFSLAPDEHAVLLLRIIDTGKNRPIPVMGSSETRAIIQTPVPPSSYSSYYADEVDSVVVSHTSTENNPAGAASLMILPDPLLSGVKAGDNISGVILRAIGGTLAEGSDYNWSLISGSLPEDLIIVDNVISGYVRRIGPFSFTVKATDDAYDPNQIPPDRSHFDTHTFNGTILPPDPLTLDMNVPVPLDPYAEDDDYSATPLATFTASGGVPSYSWTFTDASITPTGWPSGLSLLPTGNPNEMGLFGILEPGEWDIKVEIADDRLPLPQIYEEDEILAQSFTLCVEPRPLVLTPPDAADLEWFLGTEHMIQISVSNAILPPSWSASNLPDWASLVNPAAPQLEITGTPVFDPEKDYPANYTVTIEVTDPFEWCGIGPRTESTTFDIIVNPKTPEWDNKETNGGVATDVAADQNGNTYVTGYIGNEGNRDYLTVKYNSDGSKAWSMTFDGPSNGDDMAKAIVADETGAYVTGFSEGTTTGKDIYTTKYNLDGSQAWYLRYDGPSNLGDVGNVIAQDGAHVYVAGYVHRGNKSAHRDKVIIKINKADGDIVWDARYDSTRNGEDEVTAIVVDNSGYVYSAGRSQEGGNVPKSFDFLTLKFDSSGQLLWEIRDDGFNFGDDVPTAIAVDSAGNVIVTGWQNIGVDDTNFYTVKYDTDGQSVWASGQDYGGSEEDKALDIALDDADNIYVTGKLEGQNGFDYATVKYNGLTGIKLWDNVYDSGHGDDISVGVAFGLENGNGFVYVAGFKTTQSDGKDYFVIKYNAADKSIAWVGQYNSTIGVDDEATAMFMNETGLYLTGFTSDGFLTVKYSK
jgi:hypothetical protein